MLWWLTVAADFSIGAPGLFSCLLVEGRDELLLLVVVDNHQEVSRQRRRATRAELQIDWIGFKRRVPDLFALQVKCPQAEICHVRVNEFAVGYRTFRREAVLTVAAAPRALCGRKFFFFTF